ncbi:MAG: hypothetical protein N2C14_12595 [Planctomycetales bacterium]
MDRIRGAITTDQVDATDNHEATDNHDADRATGKVNAFADSRKQVKNGLVVVCHWLCQCSE